jgi:hypothetical protein
MPFRPNGRKGNEFLVDRDARDSISGKMARDGRDNPGSPTPTLVSRREMLRKMVQTGVCLPFLLEGIWIPAGCSGLGSQIFLELKPQELGPSDENFLEQLERACFQYFWEQCSTHTGLVKDRSKAAGSDKRTVASIAATGFGLTGMCIAEKRGYLPSAQIRERVLVTLRCMDQRLPREHGFFYHWMDVNTGERTWHSEISSIDTAILLAGVLTCREHFGDAEIKQLATQIYERVDWSWMLNRGILLSQGWTPENGFLKSRWDAYCELMMIYLLGLGSPTHPLPAESWDAWQRPMFEYEGLRFIGSRAPLFIHQYSHAWFDFRSKRDHYADYFANSILATEAHRRFCLSLHSRFPQYSEDLWGITASDSAHGYVVWGGPPPMGRLDGTLVPCAAGGSLAFWPHEAMRVLRTMRERFGERVWTRYGFVDAFNPQSQWFDSDVIGIDTGITMVMAENARSGFVWETFMKGAEARRGMERAGFKNAAVNAPVSSIRSRSGADRLPEFDAAQATAA